MILRFAVEENVVVDQIEPVGDGESGLVDSVADAPSVEEVPSFGVLVGSAVDPADELDDGTVGRSP